MIRPVNLCDRLVSDFVALRYTALTQQRFVGIHSPGELLNTDCSMPGNMFVYFEIHCGFQARAEVKLAVREVSKLVL